MRLRGSSLFFTFAFAGFLAFSGTPAQAGSGFFDPASIADPNSILSDSFVNAFVKTVGLTLDHRAYEPATPLGPRGFDLGIEATLTQLPGEFNDALVAAGSSSVAIPFIPLPRINLHKGMGERVDGGVSVIYGQFSGSSFRVWGFDFKAVLAQPEEGPTWALRFKYTTASVEIPDVFTVKAATSTYTPELVISRRLDFADPYIGVGYQYAAGEITLVLPAPFPESKATGRGGAAYAFAGVGMRIVPIGVKISLEGAYSPAGANSLGIKAGLSF